VFCGPKQSKDFVQTRIVRRCVCACEDLNWEGEHHV